MGVFILEAFDHPETETNREAAFAVWFQAAIPCAGVDIDGPDFNAVTARIAYKLRRGVKPHGLRVQNGAAVNFRMMMAQPRRGIDKQGE